MKERSRIVPIWLTPTAISGTLYPEADTLESTRPRGPRRQAFVVGVGPPGSGDFPHVRKDSPSQESLLWQVVKHA
jgi:hypothetical protein